MKKFEKDALEKAFGIPEPQHKDEFLDRLNIKKNNPKRRFPIVMRYASMAAFAALMINAVANLSLTADFPDQYISDKTVIPTISDTATTTSATDISFAETTATAIIDGNEIIIQTTISTAASDTDSEIVTATAYYETPTETIPAEASESPPTTTAVQPDVQVSRQTSVLTEKTNSTSTSTKTTQHTSPPQTTTQPDENSVPVTSLTIDSPPQTTYPPSTTRPYTTPTTSPPTTAKHTTTPTTVLTTADLPTVATTSAYTPPSILTTMTYATEPSIDYEKVDLTVTPVNVYAPTGIIIDKSALGTNGDVLTPPDDTANGFDGITYNQLYYKSAFLFRGIIEEIIYTDVSGQPYTVENIRITEVPMSTGSYFVHKAGSRISIYMQGGYMPVKDYAEANNIVCDYPDNYTVYSDGGNKSTQNIGDEYLFFVNYGSDDMPVGAFQLTTGNDLSVFRIEGAKYISIGNSDLVSD